MSDPIPPSPSELPAEAHHILDKIDARKRRFAIQFGLVILAFVIAAIGLLYFLGMDFKFMAKWVHFILAGLGFTLLVTVLAISLACIFALLGALGRLSKNPVANGIATTYVSVIRGTPLLVQVYMWYLALPQLGQALNKTAETFFPSITSAMLQAGLPSLQKIFTLPAIPAGIMALSVCYGAYMTETFRAGIQSINIGQREAAQALGMTQGQIMRRVILPQALRVIIPPVSNEFIAMVKDSSLVSLMGVWEMSYRALKIGRRYFMSLEMLLMAATIYWVICTILQAVQAKIEARMAKGERESH